MPIGREPTWRRVLPTLATIAGVAVFIAAGNWQRGRMDEKARLRAQLDAATAAAPVPVPTGVSDWAAWRFRPVVATGTFDAARQILIDNKVQAGVVGYAVITPLTLGDGRIVLVDRGFVPGGASRAMLPNVPPAGGMVTVRGRLNVPPAGYFEFGRAVPEGPVWQHLDPRRFTEATGVAVLPIVVEATVPTGGDDALVRDRSSPDFGIEKHWIYMLQWYSFAALAIALWLWFWLRPRVFFGKAS
ncbi:MAG TPA: SURF1 family protein [Casimicrobiaceae bacterium]